MGTLIEHKYEKLSILVGYSQTLGVGFVHVSRMKRTGDDVPIQSLLKWLVSMGMNEDLILRTDSEACIKLVGQSVA